MHVQSAAAWHSATSPSIVCMHAQWSTPDLELGRDSSIDRDAQQNFQFFCCSSMNDVLGLRHIR